MLIQLPKSRLFTTEPAVRFSAHYRCDPALWREMWRRYRVLEYTRSDLCEYFELKTGTKISHRILARWIFRTEIYHMASLALARGARTVTSEYFKHLEPAVIDELTRGLRFGGNRRTRTIV